MFTSRNKSNSTMNLSVGEGRGDVANPRRKRKMDFDSNETNVYMTDISNRVRRMHDEDNRSVETFSSTDDGVCSNGEGLQADGEVKSEKMRKGKGGKGNKRRLHWSKSPDEDAKYADWKIEVRYFPTAASPSNDVYTKDDNGQELLNREDVIRVDPFPKATESVTYSVHRSTLGVQSEYFESIFLGGYAEATKQKNTIELPTPLVTLDHFESILRFCYTETIDLNSENVVSIIHLSDYFGMEELQKQAQAYVRGVIHEVNTNINKGRRVLGSSKENVVLDHSKEKSNKIATFYQIAKAMGIEDLQRAIEHVCSKEPDLLAKECALADMPDIEFWSRLWEARKMHPDQNSLSKAVVRMWSENLAHVLDKHPGIVNLQTFRKLTDMDSLRFVSVEVAIFLMEQEHRLCLDEIEANVYLVNKSDQADALTCLQSRCIDALYSTKAGGWQISSPPNVIRGKLRKLPSIVLESILLKSMEYERAGKHFPMLVVSGAGSDFVNGVYKISGWYKSAMKFTRWGMYEGNPREFTMYRYEGEWWISIIPEHHDEPGGCEDIDFYSYDRLEDESSEWPLPPATGWITCCGESPAPRIRLLANNDADNDTDDPP